jgi:hypothetical protein
LEFSSPPTMHWATVSRASSTGSSLHALDKGGHRSGLKQVDHLWDDVVAE